MWVDSSGKKAVILRHHQAGLDRGGWIEAEVTSISYGEPVHESLLKFQLESGMTETEAIGTPPPAEPNRSNTPVCRRRPHVESLGRSRS
jgi:hypothetical protein